MNWYDWFATVYDPALEGVYRPYRRLAAKTLDPAPGSTVLDVPCGTGQSFRGLHDAVQPNGRYLGIDLSSGMIGKAQRRARGLAGVYLMELDAAELTPEHLERWVGSAVVDRLHIFLGLSVMAEWASTFDRLWGLLRPGGRAVLVDVHADELTLQGQWVQWMARADLSRKGWEPMEAVADSFERTVLSTDSVHGGTLWMATGVKREA